MFLTFNIDVFIKTIQVNVLFQMIENLLIKWKYTRCLFIKLLLRLKNLNHVLFKDTIKEIKTQFWFD